MTVSASARRRNVPLTETFRLEFDIVRRMAAIALSHQDRAQIHKLTRLQSSSLPSLTLFVTAYVLWFFTIHLYLAHRIANSGALCLSVLSFIMGYTPFHEAVHQSVSTSRFVNEWVGRLTASMLFSPYQGFRYVHLKHHRFTNKAKMDPDLWSAQGVLIFRWLSQDLYYYFIYLLDRKKNSVSARVEVVIHLLFLLTVAIWACKLGFVALVFWCWLLPARISVAWLSFTFTWLPHYPHDERAQNSAFKSTCVRTSPWLTIPLFFQNYHLIHHLYPAAPFYRYVSIWKIGRESFLAQGSKAIKAVWQLS